MWPFTPWSAQAVVDEAINHKRLQRREAIAAGLQAAAGTSATSGGNDDDNLYLQASAGEIADKIRSRQWNALNVMAAYVRSAARGHERTNCLTEVMFVEALKNASNLDTWISTASEREMASKDLLGVPLSLKDQIEYEGYDASRGFARYCKQPSKENATITDLLINAGAIPFCKTNVPQTMLAFECSNPVFGRTTNPYSDLHVPGGSSGGEAALLALDGSALGIGSDIGGSLRIPTSYSGCFALKPVAGRFPTKGVLGVVKGYEGIKSTLGPMARNIEDPELCFKVVANASMELAKYEREVLPIPFREVKVPKKLRIGYFIEDGFIPTSPACTRAVRIAVEAARTAGHECIPIELPRPAYEALEIFQALASSDAYKMLTSHLLPKESREPALFLPVFGARIPGWLRATAVWILKTFLNEKAMAACVGASGEKKAGEVWTWQDRRNEYATAVREHLWKDLKLDIVICPVQASPAVTHGATKRLSPLVLPTVLWNVVDSTVGVIPVTRVNSDLDALPSDFYSKAIKNAGTPLLSKAYYDEVYDPVKMQGLPVGIQVIGPALTEEHVLKTMKVINDALEARHGKSFGNGTSRHEGRVY